MAWSVKEKQWKQRGAVNIQVEDLKSLDSYQQLHLKRGMISANLIISVIL